MHASSRHLPVIPEHLMRSGNYRIPVKVLSHPAPQFKLPSIKQKSSARVLASSENLQMIEAKERDELQGVNLIERVKHYMYTCTRMAIVEKLKIVC